MMLTKRIDGLRQLLACCLMFVCASLTGVSAFAQDKNVSGVVLDEFDQGIPGAYVVVKGETRGAMTDDQGRFNISVSPKDVLVASFLGYTDEEITVGDQTKLTIKLVPAANELEEVVKVAYGTQRKASVIGSISSVDVKDIAAPIGQLSTGLAGKLAGVVAMQRSGEPGASAEFWIRGVNTFGANSTPLILVDGVERSMDLVDVDDIESFSILKDATATALYGVRGANGIVLITTRRGEESKPQINIKVESGFTSPTKLPEMANTEQYINFFNQLATDEGKLDMVISEFDKEMYLSGKDPDLYPSVDWVNEIFKNQAMTTKANINVTGGNKNVRYYVGGSYYFEDGILNTVNNGVYSTQLNYQKFNFRSNVDINVTKSTVLGVSLSTQFTIKNAPGGALDDILNATMKNTPIAIPLIYSDGTLSDHEFAANPYTDLNKTGYRTISSNVAQSTISLTQDFSDFVTEGLKAKVQASWDATSSTQLYRTIRPTTWFATGRDENGNLVYEDKPLMDGKNYINVSNNGQSGARVLNVEASLNYERQFAYAHRVSAMFLWNMRSRTNTNPVADTYNSSYINSHPYKTMGIAGRATYSYKDRYFAEFNFGYNGSENFAPGHRFGFFPSGALGYMISNEPWFEPAKKVVSHLKLKASYGKIGNDQIGGGRRFAYNTTLNTAASGANWGSLTSSSYVNGTTYQTIGNEAVSWEEATKFDTGIEIDFFNALKIQADYFYDMRDGIFLERLSTPGAVGMNVTQFVNIGQMVNRGFDLSAQFDYTFANGFSLSARGNLTFNRNKVLYNDQPDQIWKYQNTAGFAHRQQQGLIAEGLFTSQEEIDNWPKQEYGEVRVGDIKYRDINGDGKVNNYDMVKIGYSVVPEITYGFGLSLNWKGIDASVFFSGVDHVTRIISGNNLFGGATTSVRQEGQVFADVALNAWTTKNQNPNAAYPRQSLSGAENNRQASTFWQKDMSFLRLKNAEIGYTLPKKWTNKIKMKTLRIYVSGVNLATFSKFKLWDPEVTATNGNAYPTTRNISVGLNVNF